MPTPATPIAALSPVPNRNDPQTTFDVAFETFLSDLRNSLQPGINASVAAVYANALEVYQSALTVASQAAAAQAAVNAQKWVAGDYTEGNCRWSPSNGRVYRRLTPGTNPSATDPATDPAGWWDIAGVTGRPVVPCGPGTTIAVPDRHYILYDATSVLQLPTTGLYAGLPIEVTDLSLSSSAAVDPQSNKIRAVAEVLTIRRKYFHHVFQWSINPAIGWI